MFRFDGAQGDVAVGYNCNGFEMFQVVQDFIDFYGADRIIFASIDDYPIGVPHCFFNAGVDHFGFLFGDGGAFFCIYNDNVFLMFRDCYKVCFKNDHCVRSGICVCRNY